MAQPRPVVLGCDPGAIHTAFGVLGDGVILHSSLLDRGTTPWDEYCVEFQDALIQLTKAFSVELISIEEFSWFGTYARVEPPIRELIGIARTFSRTIPVVVIPAKEWSHAITGTKPTNRGHSFETSRNWKKTIRVALSTRFKLMGINLADVVGKDEGNHRVDSLGLSLYAQDTHYVAAHARRTPHASHAKGQG